MTTITATPGGEAAEIELTITPNDDVFYVYRTDANGTNLVRTRPGVFPRPLSGTELRRNLCSNPMLSVNTDGWIGYGAGVTLARVTGGFGAYCGRITFANAGVTGNVGAYGDFTANIPSGVDVTFSQYVRPSVARDLSLRIELRNEAGTVAGSSTGTPVLCPANTWTRLSATATSTAAISVVRCQTYLQTVTSTAGMTLDIDSTLVEPGTATMGIWFCGSNAKTATTGFRWLGTAHASASVEIEGAPFTLDDYEPANGIVNYVVVGRDDGVSSETSISTTFDMGTPWLSVPTMQTLSRPVASVLTYDAVRDTRSTIIDIPGRSDPVVVLRAMGTRRGQLEIFTGTHAEATAIISLCDRGEVLMLRQPEHMGMDMYFTALSAAVRTLQTKGAHSVFSVVLRYVETRFPPGSLLTEPGWNFADLAAGYTSFKDVSTKFRDFQAVAERKPNVGA